MGRGTGRGKPCPYMSGVSLSLVRMGAMRLRPETGYAMTMWSTPEHLYRLQLLDRLHPQRTSQFRPC